MKIIELIKDYKHPVLGFKIPKGDKFQVILETTNGYTVKHLGNLKEYLTDNCTDIYCLSKHWFKENKPKFEVGKWYKYDGHLFNYQKGFNVYGFEHGNWCELSNGNWRWDEYFTGLVPATDKEVKEALIKEAIKRGYTPYNFKCLNNNTQYGEQDLWYAKNFADGWNDVLFYGNRVLFLNGKWAEIVKDEPIKIILNNKFNNKSLTIEQIHNKLKNSDYDKEDINDILKVLQNE